MTNSFELKHVHASGDLRAADNDPQDAGPPRICWNSLVVCHVLFLSGVWEGVAPFS